jgi:hypothetical protein
VQITASVFHVSVSVRWATFEKVYKSNWSFILSVIVTSTKIKFSLPLLVWVSCDKFHSNLFSSFTDETWRADGHTWVLVTGRFLSTSCQEFKTQQFFLLLLYTSIKMVEITLASHKHGIVYFVVFAVWSGINIVFFGIIIKKKPVFHHLPCWMMLIKNMCPFNV